MKQKLLLCSGPHGGPLDNGQYFRIDSNPKNEPDVVATLPPLPVQVKSQTWQEVALIHGIEHFYLWEAEAIVWEIRSILAPGGKLVLEQPDITICAEWLLKGQDPANRDFEEQYRTIGIFGDPAHKDPGMIHKWGYYPHSLRKLLIRGGFQEDRITFYRAQFHRPDRDFRVEAIK